MFKNIKELLLRSLSLVLVTAGVAVISISALTVLAVEADIYWFDGMYCSATYASLTKFASYSPYTTSATSTNHIVAVSPSRPVASASDIAPPHDEAYVVVSEPVDTTVTYSVEYVDDEPDVVVYEIIPHEIEVGMREAVTEVRDSIKIAVDDLRQAFEASRSR